MWHLLTAAAALLGVIWQLEMTLRGVNILVPAGGPPPGSGTRVIRYLSYFTIESNILVALTCLVVAWRPDHDGRT